MTKILIKRPATELPNDNLCKPEVHTEFHKDAIVDTRYTPRNNLIVHVEGYPWVVNYYRQILGESSSVAGQNINKDAVYQQYELIHKLVLKVASPLTENQDDEKKSFSVEGSANMYPPFIPNTGDMFVADVGDGRCAIFEVNKTTRKTIFKESVYSIDYTITGYAENERIVDLDNKVIKHSYFSMDFLEAGQNPLINNSDYGLLSEIKNIYPKLLNKYLKKYYSEKYLCMVLPTEKFSVYDHFLTKAISRWYSNDDYHKLITIKEYNIDENPVMQSLSIYDVINSKDRMSFTDMFNKVKMISTNYFNINPRMIGLRYSGINYVVLPENYDDTVDTDKYRHKAFNDNCYSYGFQDDTEHDILTLNEVPLLPEINLNKTYIFSNSFYQESDDEDKSYLESQIMNYLDDKSIDAKILLTMINGYSKWSRLQQFYLTPIVLTLLKASIRRFQ
jgi:hypothetical protein